MYLDRVKAAQRRYLQLQKIMFEVQQVQSWDLVTDSVGTLRLGTRLCVPDVDELRKEIMEEAHFFSPIAFIQFLLRCITA